MLKTLWRGAVDLVRLCDAFPRTAIPRRYASPAPSMTRLLLNSSESYETAEGARARQQHSVACGVDSYSYLIKTHPDIEVDFLDDTASVVKVQAELFQAQSFLQKVTEVVL